MCFIFHPANDFIYCSQNFADVVIGAFYFSHMVFFEQFVVGSKFYFKIEIQKNKLHIYW